MLFVRYTRFTLSILLLYSCLSFTASGQSGFIPDIKKPKGFENRTLRSEKSDKGKFNFPGNFIQNNVTHYNYYYNASLKLNAILEQAKNSFKDDFSALLPFYNFTLDATAANKIQIDSLTYKAKTAIVLHDLRNEWTDNMYLLWGISYYLGKKFDSAHQLFQFINYAYAEKEKDGYYKMIGSARDGNNALNISTKEKNNYLLSRPPSRNDAFIWQIRNHLEQRQFDAAGSLLIALRNDPVFPKRLQDDLDEMQAYYYYKQGIWDSAAVYLEKALSNAATKSDKARWEYLIAQLYEKTGQYEQSLNFYEKAIVHTTDPIMDIYARLASVRVNKEEGVDNAAANIATLLKMARRDKYDSYRDIIYYMAAQIALEKDSVETAIKLLVKSTTYISNSHTQRNKAFLQLAEINYVQKNYRYARNYYDSLRLEDAAIASKYEEINFRKSLLSRLITQLDVVVRQDSLQRIAALPEKERADYVRKKVRELRKQQGLKDEVMTTGIPSEEEMQPNLFASERKGEWYFYNNSFRQKGFSDFKNRWGSRPNVDNWRRSAAVITSGTARKDHIQGNINATDAGDEMQEVTFEGLYTKLPLNADKLQQSDDSIKTALLLAGKLYAEELDDCESAITAFETIRTRFQEHVQMDEILFHLYRCYGENARAGKTMEIKDILTKNYPASNFTNIVVTGRKPQDKKPDNEGTKTYEKIYDLFIEGKFAEAIAGKREADQLYGNNYWTPQLLYIEAVYYIKQREDSTAGVILQNILDLFPENAIGPKANRLAIALSRRAEIEEELRNLVIEKPAETQTLMVKQEKPVTLVPPAKDTLLTVTPPVIEKKETLLPKDTITTLQPVIKKDTTLSVPVDTVLKKPIVKDTLVIQPPVVKKDTALSVPTDTVIQKPVVKDTLAKQPPVTKKDTVIQQPVISPAGPYAYNAAAPHYAVIILNKVDPIFVSEARNAFFRYNRDEFYSRQMSTELVEIDGDNKLLLVSPFKNAADALAYLDKVKPKVATEILPWLKGGKYTYTIISDKNMTALKEEKDIEKYKKFLESFLPGKF